MHNIANTVIAHQATKLQGGKGIELQTVRSPQYLSHQPGLEGHLYHLYQASVQNSSCITLPILLLRIKQLATTNCALSAICKQPLEGHCLGQSVRIGAK